MEKEALMKKYTNKTLQAIVLGLSSLVSLPAMSVVLTGSGPGFTDFALPGTTVAAQPDLAGLVIEDVLSNFSITGAGETLEGTIQNRVVRGDDGTLTFSWRIWPATGNGDISAFRVIGFEGFVLDANWRIDGLGVEAPGIARYFGDGSGAVNFLFDDEVGVGIDPFTNDPSTSVFFFLDTEATQYDMTGAFDLLCADTGCVSASYSTFAPAVPVPAAVWLFGSGLLGLIGVARRKSA